MRIAYIAANTFREAVRDRVLYNLIVFAFLMIGASLLLGQITIGIERELLDQPWADGDLAFSEY